MQPEVETVSGLERRVDLVVESAEIEKEVQAELKRVARTAKVQGFRPGKAPLEVIERSHGAGVRYDVINSQLGRKLDEVITKSELKVAGTPSLEPKADSTDKEKLVFTATFEVYPDVDLPDLASLEVTRTTLEVGDEQVQHTLDVLRKQRATYEVRDDRAAQDSDKITLDFTGSIDGEKFEGGSATDFEFVIGEGRMLPEFEEAVQGMKAGEEKTFPLHFPEDYPGTEVAGKTAEFEIKVKSVAEAILPEVDEEFARTLGQPEGDIEKLKQEILTNIEREVKARTFARTKTSVMDALAQACTFDIPKALVEADTQSRIQQARAELKQRGVPNADTMEIPADAFTEESQRRVKLGLLLSELVQSENLQAKQDQVKARIEEFAQSYEQPEQVVSYYMSDPQRRAEIEAIVLEDNVVDHVLSKAKVNVAEITFDEIMGTQ